MLQPRNLKNDPQEWNKNLTEFNAEGEPIAEIPRADFDKMDPNEKALQLPRFISSARQPIFTTSEGTSAYSKRVADAMGTPVTGGLDFHGFMPLAAELQFVHKKNGVVMKIMTCMEEPDWQDADPLTPGFPRHANYTERSLTPYRPHYDGFVQNIMPCRHTLPHEYRPVFFVFKGMNARERVLDAIGPNACNLGCQFINCPPEHPGLTLFLDQIQRLFDTDFGPALQFKHLIINQFDQVYPDGIIEQEVLVNAPILMHMFTSNYVAILVLRGAMYIQIIGEDFTCITEGKTIVFPAKFIFKVCYVPSEAVTLTALF